MKSREEASSNRVRVSLPASVAADIGSYKKAVASILDRLGCPACCSGFDLHFELQRNVVVPKHLGDDPIVAVPKAVKSLRGGRQNELRVGIKPELVNNLDGVFEAIERIAELSGHVACATGCDMFLEHERYFVVNHNLDVAEQWMTLGRG